MVHIYWLVSTLLALLCPYNFRPICAFWHRNQILSGEWFSNNEFAFVLLIKESHSFSECCECLLSVLQHKRWCKAWSVHDEELRSVLLSFTQCLCLFDRGRSFVSAWTMNSTAVRWATVVARLSAAHTITSSGVSASSSLSLSLSHT